MTTAWVYDSAIRDRLISIAINGATLQSFTWTASDQLASVTDYFSASESRTTAHVYDPLDRVVKTTLPDPDQYATSNGPLTSPVYTYTYGINLLISSQTDPLGNTTNYGYDPDRHFLTSVTQPDPDGASGSLQRPVTSYEYLPNGLQQREFRPEFTGGLHIEYTHDGNGQVTEINGPLPGQIELIDYDLLGRITTQTDVDGRVITYQYDIRNRVTDQIDHDPDGAGPLTGPTTSYLYDDAGRVAQVTDPLGRFTFYTYYKNGLLAQTLVQNPSPEASGPLGGGDGGAGGLAGGGGEGGGGGGGGGAPAIPAGLQGTTYVYNNANWLVETTDPSGRVTTNVYSNRGQVITVIDPLPNPDDETIPRPETHYAYDWQNRVTSVTDALDRVTIYQIDDLDRVTRVTLPDPDFYPGVSNGSLTSSVYQYQYDSVGNLTKTIDPLNRERTTQYDNLYRPIHTTEKFGAQFGAGVFSTSPYIADWYISYNDQLQIAVVIDPVGATTQRVYDSIARLTATIDDLGNETAYGYDLLNRIIIVTAPDPDAAPGGTESLVTEYDYDILSRLTSITDADGTIAQAYNDAGELIRLTDAEGNTTRFAYDLHGRLALETDALGRTTSNNYNIHGRLVRQSDRNGNITWFGQEGFTSSEYWFEHQDGAATIAVATLLDGTSGTDEQQRITISGLDGAGSFRLAFGGEVTTYIAYGSSANDVALALEALRAIEDIEVSGGGNEYVITFGGLLAGTNVDPILSDVARDIDGDVIRAIDYEYNAVGQLLSVRDYDPVDFENENDDIALSADYEFQYDQLDRLISQTETLVGLAPAIQLLTAWDKANRRTSLSATIGGINDYKNLYQYDFLDQPEWIRQQSQAGGNAVAYKRIQFRYNDIGQLTYVNRFETPTTVAGTPSLRTVLEHDDANRLLVLSHKGAEHEVATTLLNEYDYSYDFASRISSIDSTLDGLTQFSYSTSNQLTAANHDSSRPAENYLYDANGNRIGTGFIVDAQNRTLSDGVYNYLYDHEGNRTQRTLIADGSFEVNTFDHRNRLTRVDFYSFGDEVGVDAPNQSVSYTYDAFQRMVRRSVDSDGDGTAELDQFFAGFDGDNSTLEFETAGGITAIASDLAHRRLYGPFIDQLIAQENVDSLTTAGETLWPLTDHTGTIRDVAVLDDGIVGGGGTSGDFEILSHRIFNSFGLLTNEFQPDIDPVSGSPLPTGPATSIDLAHGFTGRFHDDLTGLTHHQHRWFDPQLGKWISEDPLSFAAGDINTTRYVGNAPLTYTDPTGLFAVGIDGGNGDAGHGRRNGDQVLSDDNVRSPTPRELELIREVFQGHLNEDDVFIHKGSHNIFAGKNAVTPDTTIYFHENDYRDNFAGSDREDHFIHELTHVLQSQQGHNNEGAAVDLLFRNRGFYSGAYDYNPTDLGRPLYTFNMEQQAEIIVHHFRLKRDHPMHPLLPFYEKTIGNFQTLEPRIPRPSSDIFLDINAPCFLAGTIVHLKGQAKKIEDVSIDDEVWTYDLSETRWKVEKVKEVSAHPHQGTIAKIQTDHCTVTSTGHHPFWVVRGENLNSRPKVQVIDACHEIYPDFGRWVSAADLMTGDLLLTRKNSVERINFVDVTEATVKVFNLTISHVRNFAVGMNGILVHNS